MVLSFDLYPSRRHSRSSSGPGAFFLGTETDHNADTPSDIVKPLSTVADTSDCMTVTEPEPIPERATASGDDVAAARPESTSGASSGSLDCAEATAAGPCEEEESDCYLTLCCGGGPFVKLGSTYVSYPFKLVRWNVQHSFTVVRFGVMGGAWEGD